MKEGCKFTLNINWFMIHVFISHEILNSCICVYVLWEDIAHMTINMKSQYCNLNMIMNLEEIKTKWALPRPYWACQLAHSPMACCELCPGERLSSTSCTSPSLVFFFFFLAWKIFHMIVTIVKLVEGFDLILKFDLNGLTNLNNHGQLIEFAWQQK